MVSSSSSSSSSDLLRSSSFSSSVFSVFFKSLVNSLMILCSLQLHSSQDAKKAFSFLFFLSLLGVFLFAFKSFLFNSHQIKPSPISSSLIVYLFTFGLCFVFSLSTNSNPFLYFFSCVFFFGSGHCLLIQWVCILGQRSKLTHEVQGYTFQDCPNFPFFYGLYSLEFHSSDAKKPSIFLFFVFEWGKYLILLSSPSLFRHQIKYVETFSLIVSCCVFFFLAFSFAPTQTSFVFLLCFLLVPCHCLLIKWINLDSEANLFTNFDYAPSLSLLANHMYIESQTLLAK